MSRDLRIMACVFCKDSNFQQWVDLQAHVGRSEASAKTFILERCRVESRNELDASPASQRFHDLIRRPYLTWKESA